MIFSLFAFFNIVGNMNYNNSTLLEQEFIRADTIYCYAAIDNYIQNFDTTLDKIEFTMRTYCLNDSSVFQKTSTDRSTKNKNIIEFYIFHNYVSDIYATYPNGKKFSLHLTKNSFDYASIFEVIPKMILWKNTFIRMNGNNFVCKVVLSEPDTDYQIPIIYEVSENGIIVNQEIQE